MGTITPVTVSDVTVYQGGTPGYGRVIRPHEMQQEEVQRLMKNGFSIAVKTAVEEETGFDGGVIRQRSHYVVVGFDGQKAVEFNKIGHWVYSHPDPSRDICGWCGNDCSRGRDGLDCPQCGGN